MTKWSDFREIMSIRDIPDGSYLMGYDPNTSDLTQQNFRVKVDVLKRALLPEGGTKGQILAKDDNAPNGVKSWKTPILNILGLG